MAVPKAWLAWSSGKDSAWALDVARRRGEVDVVALLTTLNKDRGRVSMHAVRDALLQAQADAVGLPLVRIGLPAPCPNDVYEAAMRRAMDRAKREGVTHVVFGDLYLEDVRAYREAHLAAAGMTGNFPLWHLDTAALAREMVDAGVRAHLTCVDPNQLAGEFAGRTYDGALLADLPSTVDPCGEKGEFHTFVSAGPAFAEPIPVRVGEVVERDGFVFADILPGASVAD